MPWPCHEMITMAKGKKAKAIRNLLAAVLGAESMKNSWHHFVGAVQSMDNVMNDAVHNSKPIDAARFVKYVRYYEDYLGNSRFSNSLCNILYMKILTFASLYSG